MAAIVWDAMDERKFDYGVDRGVLYPPDQAAVPWNGLTSVEDRTVPGSSTPYYFDGVKFADTPSLGEFSASLKAFTYPDEFLQFEGTKAVENGLFVTAQVPSTFGLSYRTAVGSALNPEAGYKIHVLQNLLATPSAKLAKTYDGNATEFEWVLTSIPSRIPGYRPTAHLIFDATNANAGFIEELEDILYGTDSTSATLPDLSWLVDFASYWSE